jgi:hypothetical protein
MWAVGLVSLAGVAGGLWWLLRPLPVVEPNADATAIRGTGETQTVVGEDADAGRGQIQREEPQQVSAARGETASDKPKAEDSARVDVHPDAAPGDAAETAKEGSLPREDKTPEREKVIPGTRFADPMAGGGSGPIMVWLPGGEFQMGSPSEEAGRNPDGGSSPVFRAARRERDRDHPGAVSAVRQATGYKWKSIGSTCLVDDAWQRHPRQQAFQRIPGYRGHGSAWLLE